MPSLEALERLADQRPAGSSAPSRRMLIIVNPYATTVSDRLKNLVVYALRGAYDVDAIDTQKQGHATEICREASHEGYDVVVAFGGDGTMNEAANGLVGSPTPLSCLPGGATNVYCRVLGIPSEIVDATEHLLALADDWRPRRVDTGVVGERHFLVSCGFGLDASVVERVDRHPHLKTRLGEYYFTYAALTTFLRRYVVRPPRLELTVGDTTLRGVTAVLQNAEPYTYFGPRPVELGEGVTLDGGTVAGIVLHRASPVDMPTVLVRLLSKRLRALNHRRIDGFSGATEGRVRSLDGRELPVQVDGDYIGDVLETTFGVAPLSLSVVA